MCSTFISFTILALCFAQLYYIVTAQGHGNSTFICTSAPDEETMREEEAVSPKLEIAVRSFFLDTNRHWRTGVVPYELSNEFSQYETEVLLNIMKYFSSISCVRWVPRRNQPDYVEIIRADNKASCSSSLGRVGGKQHLMLGAMCFKKTGGYQGAIEHEMMHTMGFIHEQQRLDRECYVKVTRAAIEMAPFDYAFVRDTDIEFPYEFGSIMHYGESKEFMKGLRGDRLGNYKGKLTKLDVMKLNHMYCEGPTYCELHLHECIRLRQVQEKCSRRDTQVQPTWYNML